MNGFINLFGMKLIRKGLLGQAPCISAISAASPGMWEVISEQERSAQPEPTTKEKA